MVITSGVISLGAAKIEEKYYQEKDTGDFKEWRAPLIKLSDKYVSSFIERLDLRFDKHLQDILEYNNGSSAVHEWIGNKILDTDDQLKRKKIYNAIINQPFGRLVYNHILEAFVAQLFRVDGALSSNLDICNKVSFSRALFG